MDAKSLGLRIREARERLSMSQEDLAAAVAKDQGAISEYENGRRKLAVADLPIFATVLEVPLTYFLEDGESTDELDTALLNYFHQLPTLEAKRAAVDLMRTLWNLLHLPQP